MFWNEHFFQKTHVQTVSLHVRVYVIKSCFSWKIHVFIGLFIRIKTVNVIILWHILVDLNIWWRTHLAGLILINSNDMDIDRSIDDHFMRNDNTQVKYKIKYHHITPLTRGYLSLSRLWYQKLNVNKKIKNIDAFKVAITIVSIYLWWPERIIFQ